MTISKKLRDVHALAVAKLGEQNTASMVIVAGRSIDGNPENVDPHYESALIGVLTKMTSSGQAIARASADFAAMHQAEAAKPKSLDPRAIMDKFNGTGDSRHAKPPTKLDAAAIYANWNSSKAANAE